MPPADTHGKAVTTITIDVSESVVRGTPAYMAPD
jgi:hypothetical protein